MKTFYFFGDSITLGVNVTPDDTWTSLVGVQLNAFGLPVPPTTFYNLGVRKNSSKSVLARFETEFMTRKLPETEAYFVFLCGTVDMAMPKSQTVHSIEESLGYTRSLIEKAKSYGQVLFMSGTPVKNEEHSERVAALALEQEKLCAELGVEFINLHEILIQNQSYVQSLTDGIHPLEMGNAAIADLVLHSKMMQNLIANS